MSAYYNGSQDREWPGSEQDPDWCYVCDRPENDCACNLDSNGPHPESACMRVKHPGGRPQGVTMPCGWGCGARLTARTMREHFTSCPAKPVPTPKRPV